MNRLIVLSGVPGSGKSHFTKEIKEALNKHVYIISSDELRYKILGNQRDLSEDALIWQIYYELVKVYSVDKIGTVVLDATHSKKIYRFDSIKPYKPLYDQIDLICFRLDKDLVIKQNADRENPIPPDALLELIDAFEMPDEEEYAFYDHIDIVKDHNTSKIISRYLEK